MRTTTHLHRTADAARSRRGPVTGGLARLAVPVAGVLAIVTSALLTGATFVLVMSVLPTSVFALLVGWTVAIGLTFALPLAAVRGVAATLERLQ